MKLKGFIILGLNLAAAIFGLVQTNIEAGSIPPEHAGLAVSALAIGNMVLRFFTNTAVGK